MDSESTSNSTSEEFYDPEDNGTEDSTVTFDATDYSDTVLSKIIVKTPTSNTPPKVQLITNNLAKQLNTGTERLSTSSDVSALSATTPRKIIGDPRLAKIYMESSESTSEIDPVSKSTQTSDSSMATDISIEDLTNLAKDDQVFIKNLETGETYAIDDLNSQSNGTKKGVLLIGKGSNIRNLLQKHYPLFKKVKDGSTTSVNKLVHKKEKETSSTKELKPEKESKKSNWSRFVYPFSSKDKFDKKESASPGKESRYIKDDFETWDDEALIKEFKKKLERKNSCCFLFKI